MRKILNQCEETCGRGRLVWFLCALILGVAASASAATFTAHLDRPSIVLGEQATLVLTFEGARPQELSQLPAIDGLRVAPSFSQGMNTTMGPTGTVVIYTYSLVLEPTRVGEFVIPALLAKANGETLSSQPVRLKVAAEEASSPPATFAARQVFLWPVLPKTGLFVGEPMVGEIRLYVRNDLRGIGDLQIPLAGDGFTFSKLVQGQRFQRRIGGVTFTVLPYYFALTPVKSGELDLGPIDGSVVLNPPGFFGGYGAQQAVLTMEAVKLRVSPLPREGVPADFSGAVGSYTLTATAGPTNVAVGDPITIKIQISGAGHLDSLKLPEHSEWREFKTYPPTSKTELSGQFGIEGTKTFEQIVIPQNADIKTLPPFSFSYFDPEQKAYRTLSQRAIPLLVRPGGSQPAPTIAGGSSSRNDAQPVARDIVPIKQRMGAIATPAPALIRRPWFLAAQSIPLLAFLGAVAWRRRGESLASNPRLRRKRAVAQIVREGVNDLRSQAAANDSDAFFATVFRLLQEQLGERLDVPAASITEAVIDERLRPRGVQESTLTALHELFQTCNLARYAPVQSSQELAAIIPKVESTLRSLREVRA
jgi:hypothetical protein